MLLLVVSLHHMLTLNQWQLKKKKTFSVASKEKQQKKKLAMQGQTEIIVG